MFSLEQINLRPHLDMLLMVQAETHNQLSKKQLHHIMQSLNHLKTWKSLHHEFSFNGY